MRPLIEIPAADGTAEALVARPDDGNHPGVLLCIDALGLRPRIQEMADRIASWGYIVLAPNTMYRSGTAAQTTPTTDLRIPEERAAYGKKVGPYLALLTGAAIDADLPHYLSALRGLDGVGEGPVGVTGYCMGAKLATRCSGLDPSVAACGGFHGAMLATDDDDSPHLTLGGAQAEFVYGHADNDQAMTPQMVERLDAALAEHGLVAQSAVYPQAPHGYTMSDTSSHQQAGEDRHWSELQALFARTLGA
ncbi:dienelactone hydrolase [Janibacter sp. Soil728]|uniref:dienelactone hydrolase family protein n=1 Tax=Janibacter sp. Soil728 TaxID=1736393 RepID=UPI0007018702|nr:dienelactone hydrolase family protein [Janibacter sp. Soil728]KRE39405.1 dienelactone hydrolase [Janibacter sp. Soil728]